MKNIANKIPNSRPDQRNDERRFPPREKQYRGYTVEVPPGGDAVRAYRKIKKMLNCKKKHQNQKPRAGAVLDVDVCNHIQHVEGCSRHEGGEHKGVAHKQLPALRSGRQHPGHNE